MANDAQLALILLTFFRQLRKLGYRSWSVVKQGSYHNNTNVRTDSDIDLCIRLDDAFFIDGPINDFPTLAEFDWELTPFTFDQYRSHIAWCLIKEFGESAVTAGKKAIHLHQDCFNAGTSASSLSGALPPIP